MIEIHLNCHVVLEIAYLTVNNDSGVRHSVLNLSVFKIIKSIKEDGHLPYNLYRLLVSW